jgi:hypothetical protein
MRVAPQPASALPRRIPPNLFSTMRKALLLRTQPLRRYLRTSFAPRPWLRRGVHLATALLVGVVCTLFARFADLANQLTLYWFHRGARHR